MVSACLFYVKLDSEPPLKCHIACISIQKINIISKFPHDYIKELLGIFITESIFVILN
jgi:hypothetical protein